MKVLWRQDDKAWARHVWLVALGGWAALSCAAEPPRAPVAAAASAAPLAPAASASSGRTVYVQRDAQGKAVYSDRPTPGLTTERQWSLESEDAESAAARREASRQQADRVTERIQRTLDLEQQRMNELQIEQLRAQQAADALQAERLREREAAAERNVLLRPPVYVPGGAPWGGHSARPQRPNTQPARTKPPARPVPPPSPLLAPPAEPR